MPTLQQNGEQDSFNQLIIDYPKLYNNANFTFCVPASWKKVIRHLSAQIDEALKRQPERQAIRLKLLEIYAGRKDATTFAHLAREARARYRRDIPDMTPALEAGLLAHDWPGNVRELRNAVDRFCLGVIAAAPGGSEGGGALTDRVDRYERQLIEAALRASGGVVSSAAEALQIPRKTLHDRITRLGIPVEAFRDGA